MKQFNNDGKLIIPLSKRKQLKDNDKNVRYVIKEAYCPKGCNIIDPTHIIHEAAGLRIKYKRADMEGEFILSAIENDFEKIILSGELKHLVKDELYCPHCEVMFQKLVNCNCQPDADMVIIGLTPKLDFNNAISFCNVTGCYNGNIIDSGDVIRHLRLYNKI
ncbi:hypothetical protein BVX93_00805 [bacterium B13(2017)]|nr:hypothetical protein BVX93_00805 [bacterium B13(2017)]